MTGGGVFVGLLSAGLVGYMFAERRVREAVSENSRGILSTLVVLTVVLAASCSEEAAAPPPVDSSASSTTSTKRTTTTAEQATTEPEITCDPARCPEWEQAVELFQAQNPVSRSEAECMVNVIAEHSDLRNVAEQGGAVFDEMSETEQNAVALDALDRCPDAMETLLEANSAP